jgi:hypothetical protein
MQRITKPNTVTDSNARKDYSQSRKKGKNMQTTMDLFSKALAFQPSAYAWCDELGLSKSTLAVAKHRGRLAPAVAGAIAMKLGEDTTKWIAIAALEAEPESSYKQQLMTRITSL